MSRNRSHVFSFELGAETLGRLFMPRASTFEVTASSNIQESFVVDSVLVQSSQGECRLAYSEWEEEHPQQGKVLVSEYAIELNVNGVLAVGTYSEAFAPDQRGAGPALEQLKRDAEDDFMLCAKLLGRSVRRDLVIDEDPADRPQGPARFH
ncbi:MAG: hypothetical protein QNJ40_22970 [Xanthomonadales bacterium]|nr:hypothetical protein [Xanthomonadales bacterium]